MNQDNSNKVLNIDEVKNTAKKETEIKKSKKTPMIMMIVGLFAISAGVGYPYLMKYLDGDTKETTEANNKPVEEPTTAKVPTELSCTKETTDEVKQIKYTDVLKYNFKEGLLTSYTDSFNLGIIEGSSGTTNFNALASAYENDKTLYSGITGVTIESSLEPTTNTYILNVSVDLTTFDKTTSPAAATLILVKESKNTTYEKVKNAMETSEYTCE